MKMAESAASIRITLEGVNETVAKLNHIVATARGLQIATLPWWRAWPLRAWWWIRRAEVR